ncbi:MAG: hypothetical protein D6770_01765 [Anaerolineae bacterium]|nr:MAG: hypothetical protein D6770_01765 [Anaerolineae bacterium]
MKTARRYTWIALLLAALACLATAFLGLLKGVQFLGVFTPREPDTLNLALQISAGTIVIGLALYALLEPDKVRRFFAGRQARYGSNALVMTLAFVGILVVVNALAFQHPKRWDLTENQEHTLAPETLDTLHALPEKVTALAFYTARTPSDTARELLMDYQANSDGKFEYRFIDPERDPIRAQQAGVTRDGTIVLQMGDRQEMVTYVSEKEVTSALVRLLNQEERVVYFLIGHGERDIESASGESMWRARQTLENKNYTVRTLNLRSEAGVPEDARVVVIAGPMRPLSQEEVDRLTAYLEQGGSVILLQDPVALTDFGTTPDPWGDFLTEQWGITLDDDLIIDPNANPPLFAVGSPDAYANHPITQTLRQLFTIFPQACSVSVSETSQEIAITELMRTDERAWGETDIASIGTDLRFNEGADIPGPLTLAVSAENSSTGARVVVIGNSAFAMDDNFDVYGNGDLFINAVDWAAEQENLLSLTPKEPVMRQFKMLTSARLVTMLLTSVCLIPGLVVLGAVSVWYQRRMRG